MFDGSWVKEGIEVGVRKSLGIKREREREGELMPDDPINT